MISGLTIEMEREKIPLDLLLTADPALPQVVRYLSQGIPFAAVMHGTTVGACILVKREGFYDIVNLAVTDDWQGKGVMRDLLYFAMDYARTRGGRYMEIGAGNAKLELFAMFQQMGFRLVGIWKDYYLSDAKTAVVENSIPNRDMLRFRLDLLEQPPRGAGVGL